MADRLATLTHGEPHALLDGSRGDELTRAGDIIARHGHLHFGAVRARYRTDLSCDITCAEVEDLSCEAVEALRRERKM